MVPQGGKLVDKTWDSGLVSTAIWDGHGHSPDDLPLNKATSLRQIYGVTGALILHAKPLISSHWLAGGDGWVGKMVPE